jgi:hypothetical protein
MRRSRTRQRYARHVSGSTAVLGSMTRYITPVGYRMLTYERDQLWKVERPKTTQEVGEATVLGDCSQGVECVYGTKKLRQIDRPLRFLSSLIDDARDRAPIARPARARLYGAERQGSLVTLIDRAPAVRPCRRCPAVEVNERTQERRGKRLLDRRRVLASRYGRRAAVAIHATARAADDSQQLRPLLEQVAAEDRLG